MNQASFDILIIDDEPVVIDSVRKILSSEGLRLDDAVDGESALYKLENNRYRVVLLDLMLPKMSGFELIEIMKRRSMTPTIVVMTGYSSVESAAQSLSMGAFDYIPKPFEMEELMAVVKRALSAGSSTKPEDDLKRLRNP